MHNFASLDTPGDPEGGKVAELSAFEKYSVSFINMVIKKSVFISINSHNFKFSKEYALIEGIIMKHLNQKSVSVPISPFLKIQ